jgi:hypothetical protein
MTDYAENKIFSNTYTLFDRTLYGGIGHGVIILPTNFFRIIFTVIFPPIGELLSIIGDKLLNEFPYITWETLMELMDIKNLNRIIYSLVLTSMFYVPGLVYTLSKLTVSRNNEKGIFKCDKNGNCV